MLSLYTMNRSLHIKRRMVSKLSSYYAPQEAEHIARRLLEEALGLPYPLIAIGGYDMEPYIPRLEEWIEHLLAREPLQYVLGYVDFIGLKIGVEPNILIPRPETEELCHLLIERGWAGKGKAIADIGTGSGAIALALAHYGARVEAIDISHQAIELARKNAESLNIELELRVADIFDPNFAPSYPSYDLVVSNPPYVLGSEASDMLPHVLDYEPSHALFVPDDDPICYYKRIYEVYHERCTLFSFEINPLAVDELDSYFGKQNREYIRDMSGRIRFLVVRS